MVNPNFSLYNINPSHNLQHLDTVELVCLTKRIILDCPSRDGDEQESSTEPTNWCSSRTKLSDDKTRFSSGTIVSKSRSLSLTTILSTFFGTRQTTICLSIIPLFKGPRIVRGSRHSKFTFGDLFIITRVLLGGFTKRNNFLQYSIYLGLLVYSQEYGLILLEIGQIRIILSITILVVTVNES